MLVELDPNAYAKANLAPPVVNPHGDSERPTLIPTLTPIEGFHLRQRRVGEFNSQLWLHSG